MGDYLVAFRPIGELLGEVMPPPPMTRRTLDLGAKHSPEAACVPFKHTLGTFIEALESGAEVLVQAGGGCRLGYYGEVQSVILRDLGFDFELISLSRQSSNLRSLVREFKRLNPKNSIRKVAHAFDVAAKKLEILDEVQDRVRREMGLAVDREAYSRLERRFVADLDAAADMAKAREVAERYRGLLDGQALHPRDDVLKIGIIGEVYVTMESFANHEIERMLIDRGVEVHRPVTLSGVVDSIIDTIRHRERIVAEAAPYLTHDIGTDGTKSVGHALRWSREGLDGAIHLRPFGCMPEVNALPALQRLANDQDFPILYLSYDAHSAEVGTVTRVEAFCDMLEMRRTRDQTGRLPAASSR